MRFYDNVKIKVFAWDWWNGCVSWRREKYIAYWWPDWWDWWDWWSIYFVWDGWKTSLMDLHYKKQIVAKRGEHWKWSQQYGKKADDIFIKVPIWTVIKNLVNWNIIWFIKKHWDKILVAKWGRWGWWNMHFCTPTRQFPNFAMLWEPWEKKEILAQLQLIWDVTLIWYPSVWKSSIINTLSNTKAKVADYSFTTLIPNLGVVNHKNKNFVIVDVPWLIKWASKWKGLWNEFLRHILKSKIWTFVLDISRFDESFKELENLKFEIERFVSEKWLEFLWNEFKNLNFKYKNDNWSLKLQVFSWNKILFEKYILFIVNKIDLVLDDKIINEYKLTLQKIIKKLFSFYEEIFFVNAWNKQMFNSFLDKIIYLIDFDLWKNSILDEYLMPQNDFINSKISENYIKNITSKELDKLIKDWYIEDIDWENIQVWEVYNPKLSYYTNIIPWWNDEAEIFFYEIMKTEWISAYLENNWVLPGDIIKVKSFYSPDSDKYIIWGLK